MGRRRAGLDVTGPGGVVSIVIHREFEQRSDEWRAARCGMVTASTIGRLVTVGAPGPSAYACPACPAVIGAPCVSLRNGLAIKTTHPARVEVATQQAATAPPVLTVADNDTSRGVLSSLAAERITGLVEDTPTTGDMWRGVLAEPFARDAYAAHYGVAVEEVGLIVHTLDNGQQVGYSPDGLVGDDGLIEAKAPRAKNHVDTILAGEIPAAYMAQLQTGLFVSGREWVDYVSFSGGLHLWTKRVVPQPEWRAVILDALAYAEAQIADRLERYKAATDGLPLTDPLPTFDDLITI